VSVAGGLPAGVRYDRGGTICRCLNIECFFGQAPRPGLGLGWKNLTLTDARGRSHGGATFVTTMLAQKLRIRE
jgi:hypothetical protein